MFQMCLPCHSYSASTQFDWNNKLFYCAIGASITSIAGVLAGLSTFVGVNGLSSKAAWYLILSGGAGAAISIKSAIQSRQKTFEEYVQSLSPEYVKEHFMTLFPYDMGDNGFSFLNSDQIAAILPLLKEPNNILLTNNHVQKLTPKQVNDHLDKIPFDRLHNLNEAHIQSLDLQDLSLYNAHRLFNTKGGRQRFSWLKADQILKLISYTKLNTSCQELLTQTQVQTISAQSLTQAQMDWLFPKTENGMAAFSRLMGAQVTIILKRDLINGKADFITATQIPDLDMAQLEQSHLNLVFPLGLMVFHSSKTRFSHLKVSQIKILQARNLLFLHLDMISRSQLCELDVNFYEKLEKKEVEVLFPLDEFSIEATKETFKNLNILQVHALLPNLSDKAPSLIFTDKQMIDLNPNKMTTLQIINLYGGPKADYAYGILQEEHRLQGSRFSLRLTELKLGNLIKRKKTY